ncbi:hypothetical protein ACIA5G_25265 [Amycolatopsis sp. NPDC051758]|uniref:hypothetical protein n=1 Tax=Amycolatopsis sp. NPDC051758 TaxID=3363935 RepID=UPI0037A82817
MTLAEGRSTRTGASHGPVLPRPARAAYLCSGGLAVVATAVAVLSLTLPSLLSGVEAAKGSLRGTALVMVCVAVPVLVVAMSLTARGSARGLVVWLGAAAYLLYQAVLFCFATPLNNLFLLYVAYLGLALWSLVTVLHAADLRAFGARLAPAMPVRWITGFALVLVLLNAGAWLVQIVPAVFSRNPASLLDGTGLLTNPVFVQDLAVWLPLLAAAAFAGRRRATWGLLVTGAMLAMFVLEGVGVATDQWFGSRADPASGIASSSMVPVFAVVALVVAVPLACYLRNVDRDPHAAEGDDRDAPSSR